MSSNNLVFEPGLRPYFYRYNPMKQIISLFILVLLCGICWAQTRKLPFLGMGNQMTRDNNAASGKMKEVTEITFDYSNPKKPDTASVFKMEFYPNGFLKLTEYSDYDTIPQKVEPGLLPITGKLPNRITDCSRIIYTYDANDNLITQTSFKIIPKNSYEALFEALADFVNKDPKKAKGDMATDVRIKSFVDSLKKAGIPEIAKHEEETRYQYDADNNMIFCRENLVDRHFSYKHYDDGRVWVLREVYPGSPPGSGHDKATAETYFTYTPNGKPATITSYVACGDTGNIAVDKRMRKKEEITYNENGLPVCILTSNLGKPYHKAERIAYKDTLQVKRTILEVNKETGKEDTTTSVVYTYRKGFKSGTTKSYRDKKVYLTEREEVFIDDSGLQTETREYRKDINKPERLVSKKLYFYR